MQACRFPLFVRVSQALDSSHSQRGRVAMRRRNWWVVGVLTLALGSGFVAPVMAADEFKIGVITSLSGDLATGGSVTKRGYDLWAKAVNAQGGIEVKGKKYPVRLIYGDDQSQPAQAASAAERLAAQEKVDAMLGPVCFRDDTGRCARPREVQDPHDHRFGRVAAHLEAEVPLHLRHHPARELHRIGGDQGPGRVAQRSEDGRDLRDERYVLQGHRRGLPEPPPSRWGSRCSGSTSCRPSRI